VVRIFVGVAWPYSNGPFHIGHLAGAYLPGDIFARFHRLRGNEVLMVSGSDMHGTPTLFRAEQEGTTPRAIAERYHAINKDAFEKLGFSFDLYTHTHTLVHERTVQEIFLTLLEHRYIDRRTEEAAYCPKHERFLPDRYLLGVCPHCGFDAARGDECDHCGRPIEPRQLGAPRCAIDGTPAEYRPSEHFYLDLDRLEAKLAQFVAEEGPHWRPGVVGVAKSFLDAGLRPTPITRDLDWGVPIPLDGYDAKRFYVWFDAVIGYLSASKEWSIRAGRPEAWRRYWDPREPVRQYYFIGKDNKFHHTIVWPGMLLGVEGLQLPYDVPANEWLRVDGEKISKSRTEGAEAFVPALLARYPPDVIRFYAALLAPQNHDTELDWDEFHQLHEEVLANQWGNLVQRTLVFARDRYDGKIPSAPADARDEDAPGGTLERLRTAHARITEEYERVRLKEALDLTLEQVRETNRWFHDARPWDASEPERSRIVREAVWRVKTLATWLAPVLPFSSADVYRMLGFSEAPRPGDWDRALEPPPSGQPLGDVRPLFPRPGVEVPRPAASVAVASSGTPDLPPLGARAGVIRAAVPHPAADKLYVLTVDLGDPTPRTVVAGLRSSYPAEELVGRSVIVLANLAPRTIRRMTSQGMVLTAEDGDRAVLLRAPDAVAPGAWLAGAGPGIREIAYEEFAATPLSVGRVIGRTAGGGSSVDLGARTVDVPGAWSEGETVVVRLAAADALRGEVLGFDGSRPVRPEAPVPLGARVR
jgi:methionyl-tRNA synthetase